MRHEDGFARAEALTDDSLECETKVFGEKCINHGIYSAIAVAWELKGEFRSGLIKLVNRRRNFFQCMECNSIQFLLPIQKTTEKSNSLMQLSQNGLMM